MQPVDTTETVGEPTSEQSTDQTVQVTEDGNGFGNDPGNHPAGDTEGNPDSNGLVAALVNQVGLGAEAEVDVLETNVAVDDTGADDGGDGDAVGDLAHQGSGGAQGGRGDFATNVVVDDDGGGEVERDFEALEHEEGLLEVLGGFHFGDETEEGDVGAVGEDDVGDGLECCVEGCLGGGVDGAAGVALDTDGDHGDHDGAEDTDEGGEGDPGHALHGTGDGKGQGDQHADQGENDGAGAVVGDCVHHDAEGEDVAAHDEDAEQELTGAEELTTEGTQKNLSGVTQVLDVRVTLTHETNVVSSVGGEETKTNNQNDTTKRIAMLASHSLFNCFASLMETHGTRPRVATALGSDRTPRETDSQIISKPHCLETKNQ